MNGKTMGGRWRQFPREALQEIRENPSLVPLVRPFDDSLIVGFVYKFNRYENFSIIKQLVNNWRENCLENV
jgi:hypothetical protein